MIEELTELEQLLMYLETTSLEPHDDYTSEFTYKDQKTLWKYIKELQQENTQLKETISIISSQLEEVKNNKTDYTQVNILEMKNTQLKSVLKEIREYINNYDVFKEFSFPLMKRVEENQVKSSIEYEFDINIKKDLLEIIDKAGIGEDK